MIQDSSDGINMHHAASVAITQFGISYHYAAVIESVPELVMRLESKAISTFSILRDFQKNGLLLLLSIVNSVLYWEPDLHSTRPAIGPGIVSNRHQLHRFILRL